MPFLVRVETRDLRPVFPSSTVSAGGRVGASVFSTLVLLLIQTSMFFLLSPSRLVRGLVASDGRRVGRLRCRRWQEFFDGVIAGVLGRGGL